MRVNGRWAAIGAGALLGVVCLAAASLHPAERFVPAENSTWADLYRHLNAEEYESLTEAQQYALNDVPLTAEGQAELPATLGDVSIATTQGYLYADTEETPGLFDSATGYILANGETDGSLYGFTNLSLHVEIGDAQIVCNTGLGITAPVPELLVVTAVYDEQSDCYVGVSSVRKEDADLCEAETTFPSAGCSDWTVQAIGVISAPEGCAGSGALLTKVTGAAANG